MWMTVIMQWTGSPSTHITLRDWAESALLGIPPPRPSWFHQLKDHSHRAVIYDLTILKAWNLTRLLAIRWLWQRKMALAHNNVTMPIAALISQISTWYVALAEYFKARHCKVRARVYKHLQQHWTRQHLHGHQPPVPIQLHAIAYFDGAARMKEGCGGNGSVLLANGTTYTARYWPASITNNEAEYYGVIDALKLAIQLGVTHLQLRGDSQLVISHILGRAKVCAPHLLPLYNNVKQLASTMHCRWTHVYRERNTAADFLSKLAPDHARTFSTSPSIGSLISDSELKQLQLHLKNDQKPP